MALHVQINISDSEGPLSQREQDVLQALAGIPAAIVSTLDVVKDESKGETLPQAEDEKPAPRRRRAAAPKPEEKPAPEPEPADDTTENAAEADDVEEDLLGGVPTVEDAIAAAQKLLDAGKAKDVKAALGTVGAARVSQLTPEQVPAFLKALG